MAKHIIDSLDNISKLIEEEKIPRGQELHKKDQRRNRNRKRCIRLYR